MFSDLLGKKGPDVLLTLKAPSKNIGLFQHSKSATRGCPIHISGESKSVQDRQSHHDHQKLFLFWHATKEHLPSEKVYQNLFKKMNSL
jgi:hypothetical protein